MCREGKCQQRVRWGYGFLDGKPVLAQHLFEFGEFRLGGVLCLEPQEPLK